MSVVTKSHYHVISSLFEMRSVVQSQEVPMSHKAPPQLVTTGNLGRKQRSLVGEVL